MSFNNYLTLFSHSFKVIFLIFRYLLSIINIEVYLTIKQVFKKFLLKCFIFWIKKIELANKIISLSLKIEPRHELKQIA